VCSSSASVCGKPKFGPCEFSAEERIPPREGMLLPLGRKSLDILIYLAERPGEVVAEKGTQRSDLVWRRYKASLRVRMAVVRKALGERQFGKRSISNIDEGLTRWSVLSSTCEWHLGLISLRGDKAEGLRARYRLRAPLYTQLGEDALEVRLHGLGTNIKASRDFLVG
jgi:hypothetical protein